MDYGNQVSEIAKYFKENEKKRENFKLGIEFEHFIVEKETLEAVSYYGDKGIEDTLRKLLPNGWSGNFQDGYLLGLSKGKKFVSLEPGSQLELSIGPCQSITDIKNEYIEFLDEIIPILEEKGHYLMAIGYQPKSKIDEIKMIPKNRYGYMFNYFKSKGKYAHNMMKGTASIQVTVDFESEEDYIRKFKIANVLSPVLYAIFDNSPIFEGQVWKENCLRTDIWANCDNDRCGIVELGLDKDFNYSKYAEYILNRPPIFVNKDNEIIFTGEKKYRELFDPDDYSTEELEHVLTMFFPDVRTKKFIEIRMADAVPYPFNFAPIAFWKGLMYNEEALNEAYEGLKSIDIEDVKAAKVDIIKHGLEGKLKGQSVREIGKWIIDLARRGLDEDEKKYLIPMEEILTQGKTPAQMSKEQMSLGRNKALDWCIVNNTLEEIKK
ncbi:glutamate--cysteine ligase [Sporosalibacterium faouarense]|uniref:glutamate--cysteine ligase n=1 Tax=Sporosalibacterium faouarense TaxID=516123 RepID=UPI00192B58E7|nr:glutamate-cysteine ligase family protein [Sporosalibacterium faouarense]